MISCVCDGAEHICTECLALVEEEEFLLDVAELQDEENYQEEKE